MFFHMSHNTLSSSELLKSYAGPNYTFCFFCCSFSLGVTHDFCLAAVQSTEVDECTFYFIFYRYSSSPSTWP